jgi:hypothetical protein
LKDKIKTNINHHYEPIPTNFNTFTKIAKKNGGYDWMTKKNRVLNSTVKCFGSGARFEPDENQKWKKKVEMWNRNESEKPIDPNNDATPGPQKYSLISTWKVKKNDDKNSKKRNYFSLVSKGPPKSIYYH